MNRRRRIATAFVALFALLFAQLATTAYACPQLRAAAAVQASDCEHERDMAPNLCERHCDFGNASLDHGKPSAPVAIANMASRPLPIVTPGHGAFPRAFAREPTGPPPARVTILRI
jgi:hypothetical protein